MLPLEDLLAQHLPEGYQFTVHLLTTPPTKCPAIFAAAPGQDPEPTECQSNFLSVSIEVDGRPLQIFAIEVLVYFTQHLATFFVSKADSTGYLYLLKLPTKTRSPFRSISTSFLQWLQEKNMRPDRRSLIALFARAQNQYLFPASVENEHKHVLDDRNLIKWWCTVLDPLLASTKDGLESEQNSLAVNDPAVDLQSSMRQGYLRVPGYDTYSTRAFFPKHAQSTSALSQYWKVADPLDLLHPPTLPERCLVPCFPDDPKSRFLIDLDDELPREEVENVSGQDVTPPSSQRQDPGRWRSVRSLDQFWEMMSFRQECSAGRLVGFLWALFVPQEVVKAQPGHGTPSGEKEEKLSPILPTPLDSQNGNGVQTLPALPVNLELDSLREPRETPLQSSAIPDSLLPDTQDRMSDIASQGQSTLPEANTKPLSAFGDLILEDSQYKEAGDMLLQLDYGNQHAATESTMKWIRETAKIANVEKWGTVIMGKKKPSIESTTTASTAAAPNVLSMGLVRKKKRPIADDPPAAPDAINSLSANLVRKKIKSGGLDEVAQRNGADETTAKG